ncbi:MAG: N-acetylmuramoyl-L-alanine amidase [Schleiferiaceae bacterium]|jgi:N-acetylmuramoyl-L-alanine amidase|nr:N-acetylmuramoyl-L-alanine amidase [Schleiferiaceae bacterium]
MNKALRIIALTAIIGFLIPSLAYVPVKKSDGKIRKVVIDAGHGGKDPGNLGTGRYKHREKNIALDVSLLVGKYITENIPDVEVVYTRKTDKWVELHERTAFANAQEADLFISIHCDAFTNPQAYGCASIVQGKNHDDENMRVAQKENSVILLEDNYEEKYEGFDPSKPETYIMLTYQQNAYFEQSISLAQKVQNQFKNRVKRKDRGVKQQPLYVTSRTSMPAILIELGFLTNKREEDFLNSKQGKELMASAIYRSFKEYKKERETQYMLINQTPNESVIAEHLEEEKEKQPEVQEEIPTDENKIDEAANDIPLYKVQIATSRQKLELLPQNFNGLSDIEFYEEYKLFKYTYGAFATMEEAKEAQKLVKQKGYSDAFVIAFYKDRKISIKEAQRLSP